MRGSWYQVDGNDEAASAAADYFEVRSVLLASGGGAADGVSSSEFGDIGREVFCFQENFCGGASYTDGELAAFSGRER